MSDDKKTDDAEIAINEDFTDDSSPYDTQFDSSEDQIVIDDQIEIDSEGSQLAGKKGKSIVIMTIVGVIALYYMYDFVFSNQDQVPENQEVSQQAGQQNFDEGPTREEVDEPASIAVVEDIDVDDPFFIPIDESVPLIPEGSIENVPTPSYPNNNRLADAPQLESFQPPITNVQVVNNDRIQNRPAPLLPGPTIIEDLNSPNDPFVNINSPEIRLPVPAPIPIQDKTLIHKLEKEDQVEPQLTLDANDAQQQAVRAQIRTGNMLKQSGASRSPTDSASFGQGGGIASLPASPAARGEVTYYGNTDIMIAQGKVIEAVLETAVSSEIRGNMRAVVSRDVYAESGRRILIPKGSRLIGNYGDFSPERNLDRIELTWTRILRPDGTDINFSTQSTDQLGRAGTKALVDNKYFEIFSNSLLVTVFAITGAIALEKVQGNDTATTSTANTNTDGSTTNTQSGTASDLAIIEGVRDITDTARTIGQSLIDSAPVFYVQQGTRILVYVNQDIVFEEDGIQYIN